MFDERKKVLVVDDDRFMRTLVDTMLREDFDVALAESGAAAVELLYRGLVPDLILLDILMPEMSGWEAFYRIRGICCLRGVPIIFGTSIPDQEARGLAMGAADYITKPYERGDLLCRIHNALKRHDAPMRMSQLEALVV
jgi:CheY-like chemotaxis protein